MTQDQKFMAEALSLAANGLGRVEPNPMVGAVIVRNGQIIARGWHKLFGGPHAEIDALRNAAAVGVDVAGATLYVTLEPCCHHGKTPPCTDAILAAHLARVVVAMADPFPAVAGKGISALRQMGVEVTVGIEEVAARELLKEYLKLRTRGRPWVIAKWAQTLDGRIATRTGDSQWISGEESRRRVHRLRSVCDGILVGVGTILADNPQLTNRSGEGKQPCRVVLDERLQTPPQSHLVQSARQVPVLIATTAAALADCPAEAETLRRLGAELLVLPACAEGVELPALLDELGRREWTRVLVEGGSRTLGSFLKGGLADELQVFLAPRLLGGREGLPCVTWEEIDLMHQAMPLPTPTAEPINGDLLLTYRLGGKP